MIAELNCLICGKHLADLEKFEYVSRSNIPFGEILIFACEGHWEEIIRALQISFPGAAARRIMVEQIPPIRPGMDMKVTLGGNPISKQ